jgi:protein TonB
MKMEKTLKWYSPAAPTGSMALATIAHGALYASVILWFTIAGTHQEIPPEPAQTIDYETFSAPPAPTPVVKHIARVEAPKEAVQTAPQPSPHPQELHDANGPAAGTQAEAKPAAVNAQQGTGDAADTPYYKIKPQYPRAALVGGIEGYILLKIDINETGTVENVRVIGGAQRSMFQDEARRAVEKWKYKPFLDASGKPIKKTDHEVRVDFKLQDA